MRLSEIKERLAAVSSAPWYRQYGRQTMVWSCLPNFIFPIVDGIPEDADADFIAHCPDDIEWLIDEVERLGREIAHV